MNIVLTLIFGTLLLLMGIFFSLFSHNAGLLFIISVTIFEILSYILINHLRRQFPWLITSKDEFPDMDRIALSKFMNSGYDSRLGWIRKPNTEKEEIGKFGKTKYHIDSSGSRSNPGHEKLPEKISFYGDSFLFGRQVNDNQTCQWYLSELTKTNILNFSVGNYGIDQAVMRLKREYPKNRTKIVIIGVVPSTIFRILCVWKHYNEYGNTFGFKPRFIIKNDKLKYIPNYVNSKEKILNFKKYLKLIRKYDYFYQAKFKKEIIEFPYFISIFRNPFRNIPLISSIIWHYWFKKDYEKKNMGGYTPSMGIIMNINLKQRYKLFRKDKRAVRLLEMILEEFKNYGRKQGFKPVFVFMPQKDDILCIKKKGKFYEKFISRVSNKILTIDLTSDLLARRDLDRIYSDDNEYGGHYSKYGNKLAADLIYQKIKKAKIV